MLIIALCLWAYSPSLSGDFLLDDNGLLTHNKLIHAPDGLARFWFTTDAADYWPLTNTAFWLQWRLWGLHPTGYRIVNLVLHLAAVFLLWAILRKLSIPGAFLAAVLFAVHPVNVESVAWISQLKNMLAMVLFLLSIWWYLRAEEEKSRRGEERKFAWDRWYCFSLLAFLLAMLSKGSVAILPVALLGLIWWQRRRIAAQDFVRTAPFFLVAGALSIVNLWFQTHGSEIVVRDATFAQRVSGAGAVVWFYLAKALAPIHLVFIYPSWRVQTGDALWWLPLTGALALTGFLWRNREEPEANWVLPILFAWGWFCAALVPVLGFTDVGFMKHSLVADHYQHIALIAVAALVAAGWSSWHRKGQGVVRWAAMVAAMLVVGALTLLTWNQNKLYANPITLYAATLEVNPNCWLAHYNLGNALTVSARPDEALEHYNRALELKPDDPEVLTNLGIAQGAIGRTREAVETYKLALRLKPEYAPAESNLGLTLVTVGQPQEAIRHLQRAIELDPDYAEAELNLGNAWLAVGRTQEAVDSFQRALQLKPEYAEALYNLGNVAVAAGDRNQAIQYYQQALQIRSNYAEALNNLGGVFYQAGRTEEAIHQFHQALRNKPQYVEAHYNLGNALYEGGRFEQAIDQFQQTVSLRPDYSEAHDSLGIALARTGRRQEAIAHFQRAIQLRPDFTKAWMDLALAYAAVKHPGDAVNSAEKAANLARAQKQSSQAQQIEDWLAKYRAEQKNGRGASSQRSGASAEP